MPMRYDAAQVDQLAAEYVLGTLDGPARLRMQRLITDRADVRFAVWRWERSLNDLALGVKPARPPRRVWKGIRSRIDPARSGKAGTRWSWRGFWVALPTAIAAAWLAVVLLPTPDAGRMAVIADQNAQALWVVSADLAQGILRTQGVNIPDIDPANSFELWLLPDEGPPLSLGLLPLDDGAIETQIPDQLLAALTAASRLAISLEPAGGSPTGQPTGPVLYQASLVSI